MSALPQWHRELRTAEYSVILSRRRRIGSRCSVRGASSSNNPDLSSAPAQHLNPFKESSNRFPSDLEKKTGCPKNQQSRSFASAQDDTLALGSLINGERVSQAQRAAAHL